MLTKTSSCIQVISIIQEEKNHSRCFLCTRLSLSCHFPYRTSPPPPPQATFNIQCKCESNKSRTMVFRLRPTDEVQNQINIIWWHQISETKGFTITKCPFWGLHTYQTLRKLVEMRRLPQVSWPFQSVDSNHKRHRLNYSNFQNCLVRVRSNQH